MAGPLTWRNVDAPNFAGAARGYEASAALLGSAIDSASRGLSDFAKDQQNTTDERVLSGLLKINDPKQYQEAVNNTDLTGVSKQGLGAIGSRAGQLLQQAALGQKMQNDQYAQNRKVSLDGISDAARPGVAAVLNAQALGDDKLLTDAYRQYGQAIANLSPEDQQKLSASGLSLRSGKLVNDGRQFQNQTNVRDDADRQSGLRLADWVRTTTDPTDPISQQASIDTSAQNPAARQIAINSLGTNPYIVGRTGSTGRGAPVAAGGGGGSTFDRLLQQESSGRQFNDDGSLVVSPKGAQGIAQLMPNTAPEAAKLAGLPYDAERVKNDPQYNATLGRAYYNKQLQDFGGDEQKALAAYNAGPQATRDAIAKAEKSGNPDAWLSNLPTETQKYVPSIQGRGGNQDFAVTDAQVKQPSISGSEVNAAQLQVNDRLNQNQSQGISADLQAAYKNTDSPGKVVNDLIASDFPSADRGKLTSRLTEIMSQTGAGAAVAGAILRRNQSAASGLPLTRDFAGTTDLGGGVGFRDAGVQADINSLKVGLTNDQVLANDTTKAVADNIDSAKQDYADAQTALNNWNSLVSRRPGLSDNDQAPRLEAAVNKASQKLQAALAKQRQEPAFASRRAQPTAKPEQKNQNLNTVPDPKSTAQTVDSRLLPRDFGLYD